MQPIIEKYWKEFVIVILIISIIILSLLYINKKNKDPEEQLTLNEFSEASSKIEEKEELLANIKVDIKGAVAKPGVYELEANSILNDAIKLAGGLKKSADTSNINLSKTLENEMVIKIFTTNELKKISKSKEVVSNDNICTENTIIIDKCNDSSIIKDVDLPNNNDVLQNEEQKDTNQNNLGKLISINTGTIEELITLPGIGESKAENIIKYREENGAFKAIEEIINVSGIGDAAYQKIKDFITI